MEHKTKKVKRYSERFKQELVSQICAGLLSKSDAIKKYGVSRGIIAYWCQSYGVSPGIERIDLDLGLMESPVEKEQDESVPLGDDPAALKRRLSELEVKLRAAELRALAAELIIDLAEKDLGLEIRKKFDTRQSGK